MTTNGSFFVLAQRISTDQFFVGSKRTTSRLVVSSPSRRSSENRSTRSLREESSFGRNSTSEPTYFWIRSAADAQIRVLFSLTKEKQVVWLADHKQYVIDRLNADFQKPWVRFSIVISSLHD